MTAARAAARAADLPPGFLEEVDRRVGRRGWTIEPDQLAPHAAEQWGTWRGRTPLLLRPANTGEVAALLELCHAHEVPVVPQGGNTGLVGAGVPDGSGRIAVLSLGRLNRIRAVDPLNDTITAEAGCVLEAVAGRRRRGRPPVAAVARRPGLVPDRRQHREQCRRSERAALRHGARAGPGPRSGAGGRPDLGWAAQPAQGQYRLRPEAAVHRRRRHARA